MPRHIDSVDSDDKWLITGAIADAIGILRASVNYGSDAHIDAALSDLTFARDRLTELFSRRQ
jgi:hypothetical protein